MVYMCSSLLQLTVESRDLYQGVKKLLLLQVALFEQSVRIITTCKILKTKAKYCKFLIIESPTLKKMFSCCNFCFPCGIPTSSMILVFKVGVLLQQLGKVLEQAVLRSEKVK